MNESILHFKSWRVRLLPTPFCATHSLVFAAVTWLLNLPSVTQGHQSSGSGEQFNELEKQRLRYEPGHVFLPPLPSTHAGVAEPRNGLRHPLHLPQGPELKWIQQHQQHREDWEREVGIFPTHPSCCWRNSAFSSPQTSLNYGGTWILHSAVTSSLSKAWLKWDILEILTKGKR